MKKVRLCIDLDERIIQIVEKEAMKQKRSLKSFLEQTIEETATRLASPSKEYKAMMDDLLERVAEGKVDYVPIEEIEKSMDFKAIYLNLKGQQIINERQDF